MVTNFALLSTCLTTLASAWTTPVGSNPSGNPILKPLNEIVPVGQVFQIKWTVSVVTYTRYHHYGPKIWRLIRSIRLAYEHRDRHSFAVART